MEISKYFKFLRDPAMLRLGETYKSNPEYSEAVVKRLGPTETQFSDMPDWGDQQGKALPGVPAASTGSGTLALMSGVAKSLQVPAKSTVDMGRLTTPIDPARQVRTESGPGGKKNTVWDADAYYAEQERFRDEIEALPEGEKDSPERSFRERALGKSGVGPRPKRGQSDSEFLGKLDQMANMAGRVEISASTLFRAVGGDPEKYRQALEYAATLPSVRVNLQDIGTVAKDTDTATRLRLYDVHRTVAPDRPEALSMKDLKAFYGEDSASAFADKFMEAGNTVLMNEAEARSKIRPNKEDPYVYFVEPVGIDGPATIYWNENEAHRQAKKGDFRISRVPTKTFRHPGMEEARLPVTLSPDGKSAQVMTANNGWYYELPGFEAVGRYGKKKEGNQWVPDEQIRPFRDMGLPSAAVWGPPDLFGIPTPTDPSQYAAYKKSYETEVMARAIGVSLPTENEKILAERMKEAAEASKGWGENIPVIGTFIGMGKRNIQRAVLAADLWANRVAGNIGMKTLPDEFYGNVLQEAEDFGTLAQDLDYFASFSLTGDLDKKYEKLIDLGKWKQHLSRSVRHGVGIAMDVLPFIPVVTPAGAAVSTASRIANLQFGRYAFRGAAGFATMEAVDELGSLMIGRTIHGDPEAGRPFRFAIQAASRITALGLEQIPGFSEEMARDVGEFGGLVLFHHASRAKKIYDDYQTGKNALKEYENIKKLFESEDYNYDVIVSNLIKDATELKLDERVLVNDMKHRLTALKWWAERHWDLTTKNIFPSAKGMHRAAMIDNWRKGFDQSSRAISDLQRASIENVEPFVVESPPADLGPAPEASPEASPPAEPKLKPYGEGLTPRAVRPGENVAPEFEAWLKEFPDNPAPSLELQQKWAEIQVNRFSEALERGEAYHVPEKVLDQLARVAEESGDIVLQSTIPVMRTAMESQLGVEHRGLFLGEDMPSYETWTRELGVPEDAEHALIWAKSVANRAAELLEGNPHILQFPKEQWNLAEKILKEGDPRTAEVFTDIRKLGEFGGAAVEAPGDIELFGEFEHNLENAMREKDGRESIEEEIQRLKELADYVEEGRAQQREAQAREDLQLKLRPFYKRLFDLRMEAEGLDKLDRESMTLEQYERRIDIQLGRRHINDAILGALRSGEVPDLAEVEKSAPTARSKQMVYKEMEYTPREKGPVDWSLFPVLNFVKQHGGVKSEATHRKEAKGKGANLPGVPAAFDAISGLRAELQGEFKLNSIVYSRNSGASTWDQLAESYRRETGWVGEEGDFIRLLEKEVRQFKRERGAEDEGAKSKRMERQFRIDTFSGKDREHEFRQALDPALLRTGDYFSVNGQRVEVYDGYTEQAGYAILHSDAYGFQMVRPGERLRVDRESFATKRSEREQIDDILRREGIDPEPYWKEQEENLPASGEGVEFRVGQGVEIQVGVQRSTKAQPRRKPMTPEEIEENSDRVAGAISDSWERSRNRHRPENEGRSLSPAAAYLIATRLGGPFADIVVRRNAAELQRGATGLIEGIMQAYPDDAPRAKSLIRIGLTRDLAAGERVMTMALPKNRAGWGGFLSDAMQVLEEAIKKSGADPANIVFDIVDYGPKGGGEKFSAYYRDPQYLSSVLFHEVFHADTYMPQGTKQAGSAAGTLLDMLTQTRAEMAAVLSPTGKVTGWRRETINPNRLAVSLDPSRPMNIKRALEIWNELKARYAKHKGQKLLESQLHDLQDEFDLRMRAEGWVSYNEIRKQLIALSSSTRERMGMRDRDYRESDQELYADFGAAYFSDYASARAIAGDAVRLWEAHLAKNPAFAELIDATLGFVAGDKIPEIAGAHLLKGMGMMAEKGAAAREKAEEERLWYLRAATKDREAGFYENNRETITATKRALLHRHAALRGLVKETTQQAMHEIEKAEGPNWNEKQKELARRMLGARGEALINDLERICHIHDIAFLYYDGFNRNVFRAAEKLPEVRLTEFDGTVHTVKGAQLLGFWSILKSIETTRKFDINTQGIGPKESVKIQKQIREQIGDKAYADLEHQWRTWRQLRHDYVFPLLRKSGTHNDAILRAMETTEYYAPQSTSVNPQPTAHVFRKIGNMKDINNPLFTLPAHDLKLIEAAILNQAKRSFYEFTKTYIPESMQRVIYDVNPHLPLKYRPGYVKMFHLDKGKKVEYMVPEIIEASLNNKTWGASWEKTLDAIGRMNKPIRALQYAISLQWMFRNVWKDSLSTLKKNPEIGKHPLEYMKTWVSVLPAVLKYRFRGVVNDFDLTDAIKAGAITPKTSWAKLLDPVRANSLEKAMASYGEHLAGVTDRTLGEKMKHWIGLGFLFDKAGISEKTGGNLIETLMALGDVSDMVTKLTGYKMLKQAGLKGPALAMRVRNHVGTPDYLASGTAQPLTNNVFMYSNIAKNGLMSAWTQAKQNPGNFALYQLAQSVPTIMLAGALYGLFGPDAQEEARGLYGHIPEYELRRKGMIIPLGGDFGPEGDKGFFVGFDQDHEGQYIQTMMHDTIKYFGHLVSGRDKSLSATEYFKDIQDLAMKQVYPYKPGGVADFIYTTAAWGAFGVNLKDTFGRPVVSRRAEDQWKAGSPTAALSDILRYGLQTTGAEKWLAPVFGGPSGNSTAENLMKSPFNPVGGFMGTTSRGESEWAQAKADEVAYQEALEQDGRSKAITRHADQAGGEYVESDVDRLYDQLVDDKLIDPKRYRKAQFRYQYKQTLAKSSKFALVSNMAYCQSTRQRKAYAEMVRNDPSVSPEEKQAFEEAVKEYRLLPEEED
jgi:hypothetical protein